MSRPTLRPVLLVVILAATPAAAQQPSAPPAAPLEFEVASIKPNSNGTGTSMRTLPDGTFVAVNTPIRGIIGTAYRSDDGQYRGLPEWALRERYDVIVKPPAGTQRPQLTEMWRRFFRERMKLEAHEETRDTPVYHLVLDRADGRLGPQLKPSPHDCEAEAAAARAGGPPRQPQTFPTAEAIMAGCGALFGRGRMISGGTQLATILPTLRGMVGRPIEDRTGLTGYYTMTLTYSQSRSTPDGTAADPADAPDIFTALREQLGLKLEPARAQIQTVVIDHIERPTEN